MSQHTLPVAVRVKQASKQFSVKKVLDQFSLDIHEGEFVALLGKSGSGKTTLLRILAGLETVDAGEVLVPPVRTVVFQEPRLIESKRVLPNVLLGLPIDDDTRRAAKNALAEVGLASHEDAWPSTLSGGEAQRVALARALIRQPKLLMLDETFAALDALTRLKMQALVQSLCQRYTPAVLLVTHDVDEAIQLADRVLVLADGKVAVDARISLEHPRSRGNAGFDQLRQQLLQALGVFQE